MLVWILTCLLLVIPLLWFSSHVFRYYAKYTLYVLWIVIMACVCTPAFILRPFHVQNVWLTHVWLRNTLWLFGVRWDYEVRHVTNLEYDKPCVIVSNHQSVLDVMAVTGIYPPRTTALAKKSLLYFGPFGVVYWLAGLIFVDRTNSRENAQRMMRKTAEIMKSRGANVWICPEGTRHCGEHLLPFKKGAFHLAIEAQVPIFPVVLSSYRDFLSSDRKIFNKGKQIITCLPRVETAGLTADDVTSLTDKVRDLMESVFLSTTAEVHQLAISQGVSILTDTRSDEGRLDSSAKNVNNNGTKLHS